MRVLTRIATALLCATLVSALWAGVILEPKAAPEWEVSEWINGDPGKLTSFRGKLVLIHFFQLWCPGCNDFSIPLFEKWEQEFGVRDDVMIVSIHTVFEGHDVQTPARLREFVAEKGITHPVGIDAYPAPGAKVPITMDLFETGGTPHVAIVDKDGDLRFSHFGRFDPEPIERFITRILEESDKKKSTTRSRSSDKDRDKGDARSTRQKKGWERRDRNKPAADPEPPPREPEPAPPTDPAAEFEEAIQEAEAQAEEEARGQGDDEEEEEGPAEDAELSGSYKLRFEPLSVSCGDLGKPVEVITQFKVTPDSIAAKFSRPYAGLRDMTVAFDSGSSTFDAEVQREGTEKGGVKVDVTVQVNGRFVSIGEPPEVEFNYYVDKRSEDGQVDCVIEGRGSGARFRTR